MYVAKAQHAGVVRYDAEHDHYDAANLGLIADLRRAIDADELVMHYQPKAALERRARRRRRGAGALAAPHPGPAVPGPLHPHVRADRPHRPAHRRGSCARALTDVRDLGARGGVGERVGPHPRPGPTSPTRSSTCSATSACRPSGSSSRSPRRRCSPTRPAPRRCWPSSTPSASG